MEEKPVSDTQTAAVKHGKEVQTNWFLRMFPPARCFFLMPFLLILSVSLGMTLYSIEDKIYYNIILFLIMFALLILICFIKYVTYHVTYLFKKWSDINIYAKIIAAAILTIIVILHIMVFYGNTYGVSWVYEFAFTITYITAAFLPLIGFISCVIYLFKKGSNIYERIMSLITIISIISWYFHYLLICAFALRCLGL